MKSFTIKLSVKDEMPTIEYFIKMFGPGDTEGEVITGYVVVQDVISNECVLGKYSADDNELVGKMNSREESLKFLDLYLQNLKLTQIYNYKFPDGKIRIPQHVWIDNSATSICYVNGEKQFEKINTISEDELDELKQTRNEIFSGILSEENSDGSKPVSRGIYE